MSIEAMQWAFRQEIKPSSVKFVLVSLADNATEDGLAWPSIAALCAKTGQDRKTVIASLDRLEQAGYLADSGERRGGTGQVKVYRFNFDGEKQCLKRNSSENGTVPKTDGNSTVFPYKESRISLETVPKTVHGTQRNPKETTGNPHKAQAPKKSESAWKPLDALLAAGVTEKVARAWIKARDAKKSPVTEVVIDSATTEAEKAGITLDKALEIACYRGWIGYRAEWLRKHLEEAGHAIGGNGQPMNKQEALEHQNAEVARRLSERKK